MCVAQAQRMGGPQQQLRAAGRAGNAKPNGLKHLRRYARSFLALAVVSSSAGFQVARLHEAKWESADTVQAASISESARAMKIEREELSQLAPQQQAERLLERAIHRDAESLELIGQNVGSWRGRLQNTDRLFDLEHAALDSADIQVRGAAIEIDLAANNLSKSPASVARLERQVRTDPSHRAWALWRLGALGNRGVEPGPVFAQLLAYVRDPNEQTRFWAVEGLAILGSDAAIDPLLDRFAHDPSPRVRLRAGCNLAQAGMLTRAQRLGAVPQLLNFFDDDALDSATRGWVYGALRLITGEALGNDAGAWRKWWANRDTRHKPSSRRTGILFA
jgi:HEAT repeat protein